VVVVVVDSVPCALAVPAAFLPGFPSTSPTSFSALPTTLSTTFSFLVRGFFTVLTFAPVVFFVVVALGFAAVVVLGLVTRPVATLVERGLEVLAVVLEATTSSICSTILGLLLPEIRY
jgi:hypothetical protein